MTWAGSIAGDYITDGGKTALNIRDDGTFRVVTKKGQTIVGTWTQTGDALVMAGDPDRGIPMTVNARLQDNNVIMKFGPKETRLVKQ